MFFRRRRKTKEEKINEALKTSFEDSDKIDDLLLAMQIATGYSEEDFLKATAALADTLIDEGNDIERAVGWTIYKYLNKASAYEILLNYLLEDD